MARFGLTLPIFGPLSEPGAVAELEVAAEDAGFDGVFVWDHVLYRRDPDGSAPQGRADVPVADPWVTLAAMAAVTDDVRLGAMVTPLPRRRPQVLARQVTSVDLLSEGRVVVGVGLGGDGYGEFSAFGDERGARTRGAMVNQRIDLLRELWSGQVVDSDRSHAPAHDVQFLPRPLQNPHPPIWVARRWPHRAPRRRAAQADGWFPIDLPGPDALAEGCPRPWPTAAARSRTSRSWWTVTPPPTPLRMSMPERRGG